MKTIAVVCEKGGTGKTMLAQELFYYFQRREVPVSLYSLDPQYAGKTQRTNEPAVVVIDTPGSRNERTDEVIKGADVVIVPTCPSPGADLAPFLRTAEAVRNAGVPLVVVVNRWNRFRVAAAFCDWLRKRNLTKDIFFIPQSEAVVQAMMNECSVYDINQCAKVSVTILEVCERVNAIIGM